MFGLRLEVYAKGIFEQWYAAERNVYGLIEQRATRTLEVELTDSQAEAQCAGQAGDILQARIRGQILKKDLVLHPY